MKCTHKALGRSVQEMADIRVVWRFMINASCDRKAGIGSWGQAELVANYVMTQFGNPSAAVVNAKQVAKLRSDAQLRSPQYVKQDDTD